MPDPQPPVDVCGKCKERPRSETSPRYCEVCARKAEAAARQERASRARASARRHAPPERIVLEPEASLALIAAVRTLDAARDRVGTIEALVFRHGIDVSRLLPNIADALVGMVDAYDDALRLLDPALPIGVVPPRNQPRRRVSRELRATVRGD